ncbi:MAG: HAMP domain-containing histidine kinase [Chitinophagaceae bacterium]|nr:MAG: HAMP domain-containing histidine kinase [Chitinophagaceae bacterium]
MKLLSKLTLFTTVSKLAILLVFVAAIPYLVDRVAFNNTNYQLRQQEEKVFSNIRDNGIDYYLEGDSTYASYTMLKEEYISIASAELDHLPDTMMTSQRIIENDTLNYRILSRTFQFEGKNYNLEIARTISSIGQYNRPLQRIALYVLAGLVLLTLVADLLYTRILLKPLSAIIRIRIRDNRFPFKKLREPVRTSTSDFRYLDDSLINLMQQVNDDFEREREFTSNASHELMTPIGILQSKMENLLLLHEGDEALQEKLIGQMKTLNRLKKIVNSLMLISRIDNEQYRRDDTVLPGRLLQEVAGELEHRLEQQDIQLAIHLSSGKRISGMNQDLLFQLFHNLLNNAIRYNTPGGRISITDSQTSNGYQLSIGDTGIGIAAADLPLIFNRFKKTSNGSEEGNGLGLSIVKSIADYLNLRIEVESTPGKGSQFHVLFPDV